MSNESSSSLIKTFRCPTCGAPLRPSAESILVVCNFCGSVFAESPIDPHFIVKPQPLTPPEDFGAVRKMELILVPFFEVAAEVDIEALGYQRRERTETRTVRRGGKTYTESKTIVEYRPWRIEHHGTQAIRFLARQEISLFGAREFICNVSKNIGGETTPFDSEFIKNLASQDPANDLDVLSLEWGQDEAARKAGEKVYETAYSQAKSQMHEVFDTRVNFKPLAKPKLIHEPILLVQRNYQGRMYRAAYHWGNKKLLRKEEPIKNRGLMVFLAFLSALASPVFAQLTYNFYLTNDTILMIVMGVLGVACIVALILLMVRVYKPHKIKSSGTSLSYTDFQAIAPPPEEPQSDQTKSMKFCPKCGDPIDPGQEFCEKCGYKLTRSR
ncbi:MAG: zinc ribbon domain-containing protein [Asgard group archaeon]|nr:zinc ribbon domain-containing protein [Asgard group archaeon]